LEGLKKGKNRRGKLANRFIKKAIKADAMKFEPFVRPGWMAQSHYECRASTLQHATL
jgi:hypothetical protein